MFTLFVFVVVLAILVLSHEFGHFIVARKNDIRVSEFGFGFPPRLFGVRRITVNGKTRWQWVGRRRGYDDEAHLPTLYSFNLIPLGGFVRIKGENAAETGAAESDSFASKKVWQKIAVLIAGVGMNVLVAFVLLSVGYMIGMPQTAADENAVLQNISLQIVDVLKDKPAAKGELLPGDVVMKLDVIDNPTIPQFQDYVASHENRIIFLTIKRDGQLLDKTLKPEQLAETGKAGIGVALAEVGVVKYSWYKAPYYGMLATGFYLKAIVVSFYDLLRGIFSGRGVGGAVSGPIGVAVMTGEVARLGLVYLLQFTALLSLNLAVLNILPIPALDGGRLFFIVLSKVMRRRLNVHVEQIAHLVGFILLIALVVVVTIKDIGLFGGGFINWVTHLL